MFVTVKCLVLSMCILISCSSVWVIGYVYVCESYVIIDQCNFFSDLCEFCFLYCDDVWLGWRFFSSSILFLIVTVYVDLKYDAICVLWLIVVCEWVDGDLLVMGCCVVCAWCCCYDLCGFVNGASPVRFVFSSGGAETGSRKRRPACPKIGIRPPTLVAGVV